MAIGGKRPGAGRPRESERVAVRLPLDQVETIDALAARDHAGNRSEAMRDVVTAGLDALARD